MHVGHVLVGRQRWWAGHSDHRPAMASQPMPDHPFRGPTCACLCRCCISRGHTAIKVTAIKVTACGMACRCSRAWWKRRWSAPRCWRSWRRTACARSNAARGVVQAGGQDVAGRAALLTFSPPTPRSSPLLSSPLLSSPLLSTLSPASCLFAGLVCTSRLGARQSPQAALAGRSGRRRWHGMLAWRYGGIAWRCWLAAMHPLQSNASAQCNACMNSKQRMRLSRARQWRAGSWAARLASLLAPAHEPVETCGSYSRRCQSAPYVTLTRSQTRRGAGL